MAKYCIEIDVPSELDQDSKAAQIHMYLENLSLPYWADQIAALEVDEQVENGPVAISRTE